jgi:phosphonate transport system substrate-binding protein
LFELIAASLGPDTELAVDTRASGPPPGELDPFTTGAADVGFMCSPPYLRLRRSGGSASVELLGVAPVFDDPRCSGRPTYFADVVVPAGTGRQGFAALRGATLGVNDPSSLSGLLALELHLAEQGLDLSFFGEVVVTGSHDRSLDALAQGEIDVASIDGTTLRARRSDGFVAALATDIVMSLGPHPVQPVVVRTDLDVDTRRHVHRTLATLATREAPALAAFGCTGFATVVDADYERLGARLAVLPAFTDGAP